MNVVVFSLKTHDLAVCLLRVTDRYYCQIKISYVLIGVIQKDDRAGHNLTVLNKKNELKTYLKLFYNIK